MADNTENRPRRRRSGGGRKPKPDKLIARQFYLEQWQAKALKEAADNASMTQSEWIRRLLNDQLYG